MSMASLWRGGCDGSFNLAHQAVLSMRCRVDYLGFLRGDDFIRRPLLFFT